MVRHYLSLWQHFARAKEQQMDVLTILPMAILTGKRNHNHVKCKCFLINGPILCELIRSLACALDSFEL